MTMKRMVSDVKSEKLAQELKDLETRGDDELKGSDVILPPADLSFDEAGRDFTGDGLIPD